MKDKQIVKYPLKEIMLYDGKLTGGIKYNYVMLSDKLFRPQNFQKAFLTSPTSISGYNIENYLSTELTYEYDKFGNILQTTDRNGIATTYVWGYGGLYLIARIINANYTQVQTRLGVNLKTGVIAGALTSSQDTSLRGLSGCEVTTYTHSPMIGVASVKDPTGCITYYSYDNYGRLEYVRDEQNNVLEKYQYNIKN